ncbi:Lecithin:cholesterol acyltransferase-domain-containing protein [Tribonema minus]|uniref:Lecithin:cholesterol acyltransferase-domain-containing protein n=1 Tax=Tribonema minus TaxID=303371 RepID=A0A836CJX4_9STRA|nr:Lecithin:cholesterol acyltransferase-domain-containing protein [Tribonema minus]
MDFMTNLNISLDVMDIDARGMWENVYGGTLGSMRTPNATEDIAPGIRARRAGLAMHHPVDTQSALMLLSNWLRQLCCQQRRPKRPQQPSLSRARLCHRHRRYRRRPRRRRRQVIVPGFTSSGLEIWDGEECLRHYFRQRVWGTSSMLQALLADKMCWLRHMELDSETGLDPPGRKLRSAVGLEAADYVFRGYWVWGKVIENLAEIGYTSNEMYMASYDWRLSPWMAEKRDGFLTRLKHTLETALEVSGTPAVMMSHSFGGQVVYFFLNWVESENGGKGGDGWVAKHVAGVANVAGSLLGVPKAVSALLSGEFKDTAQLGTMSAALDYYLSPERRAHLLRTWSSLVTMLPKGGSAIWGNATWAPDDTAVPLTPSNDGTQEEAEPPHCPTYGNMISFVPDVVPPVAGNMTWEDAWRTLILPRLDHRLYTDEAEAANLVAADIEDLGNDARYDHPMYWSNPLASALPNAPNMRIWCMYGANNSAERGYLYRTSPYEEAQTCTEDAGNCTLPVDGEEELISVPYTIWNAAPSLYSVLQVEISTLPAGNCTLPLDGEEELIFVRARSANSAPSNGCFSQGMRLVNGDGTVPLLSLGYMCSEGWKNDKYPYNPSKINVTTVEYPHLPAGFSLRGGGTSGDHIDVLGNVELLEGLMAIAAGKGDLIRERVITNIKEVSASIDLLTHPSRGRPT